MELIFFTFLWLFSVKFVPRASVHCLPGLHFNISESLSGELLGDAVGQRG